MGTQLQDKGLPAGASPELFMMEHGEIIEDVHAAYIDSGSDIIYTNTFGANAKKLCKSQYTVEEVITRAVQLAKSAAKRRNGVQVALDIGPIGELLEPNGYLPFEEAYELYRQQVVAGEQAGADLVIFETMSDLYEVKAAILAAKEHTQLPVFVTMSFEADHRTFTGCTTASFALCAEGLGADAIGINCSLGPDQILPIAEELAAMTNLPLIIKANAGLPDPLTNTYSIDAAAYARMLLPYTKLPLAYVGCCGTTPQFIQELKNTLPKTIAVEKRKRRIGSYACTPTKCLRIQDVHVIGERINPTGNKRMKAALQEHRMDEILAIAMEEVEGGADILDVNVGLPGIDEKEMMVEVIKELQSVIDLPLQIDSTDPAVIRAALRAVNGVAIVNSVNGEAAVMESILPAVKKYGANVVGLTMDEDGIPACAQKRLEIGTRIVETAQRYGIAKERVFLDCLTLTVSAQQSGAKETLQALTAIREQLGVHTVLGVSNISFGLPSRILLNQSFLTMAMQAGLSMPIMNPNQAAMMDAVRSYRVLQGIDVDSQEYIRIYAQQKREGGKPHIESVHINIEESIMRGLKEETRQLCTKLLSEKEPLQIVNEHLIPALDAVGARYEKKEIYLPQLINAATASQCAFEEIRRSVQAGGLESISKGKIILATVKGDVHDIGKNIVKVVLENYGYQVFDLGKDVPVETVVETAIKEQVRLIGLSALMTTTLKSMEETIQALHESGHECKIMVGGAVVSADYAKQIHADYYARDAKESADIAKEVLG